MQGVSRRDRPGSSFFSIPLVGWLFLFGLGGGIVGLGGFTFNSASGLSYFSDNPQACANCHVMRDFYDGWIKGPHHADATCNQCHTPQSSLVAEYAIKALDGFNHSKAFTLNDIPDPIRITPLSRDIVQGNCLYCHGEMVSQISHPDSRNPTDCLTCHVGVGHGR